MLNKEFVLFAETKEEIENVLIQIENCLDLLLPNPDEFNLLNFESAEDLLRNKTNNESKKNESNSKNSSGKRKVKKETNMETSYDEACIKQEIESNNSIQEHGKILSSRSKQETNRKHCKHADERLHKGKNRANKPVEVLGVTIKEEPISDIEENQESSTDEEEEEAFEEVGDLSEDSLVRHHGLGTQGYELNIDMSQVAFQVEENEDNTDILHTLKDLHKLIGQKFLTATSTWLEVSRNLLFLIK